MKKTSLLFLAALLSACASTTPRHAQVETVAEAAPPVVRDLDSEAGESDPKGKDLRDLAISAYLKGDFPRAANLFDSAFLLDGSLDPWGRYLSYYCSLASGDYIRALEDAERIAQARPYEALSYFQAGLAQLWLGRADAALDSFTRTLEFDNHPIRVHFYLGLTYGRQGNTLARDKTFAEGEKEYLQVLKLNPRDFTANYELSSLYLYWNRNVDKVPLLLNSARLSLGEESEEELPESKKYFLTYYLPVSEGILHFRKGDAQISLKRFIDTLPKAPSGVRADIAEVYYYIGKSYAQLDQKNNAQSFFERARTLDPNGIYSKDIDEALKGISPR
jgi:tetratricopeptide (TPR) repeat protein